jgi:hypothetical protein
MTHCTHSGRALSLRRAALFAAVVSFSFVTSSVLRADPYYVSWSQLYDDTVLESERPHAIALDSRGNVFVTGQTDSGQGQAFYTAKYDGLDGHLVWQKLVSSGGTNQYIANAIAVDSQGDCVVTGSRNLGGAIDYYTVKYHGTDGSPYWAFPKTFNGANDGEDTALKVVCDGADNVIVTGRSVGNNGSNSTGFDFATIKYAKADGAQLGIDLYTQTSGNLDDVPAALAVDSSNNIFVGGTVMTASGQRRFYLRKLKSLDLTKLWDIVPINTGDEGGVTALAVGTDNSVVATGMFVDATSHFGYFTAKYDTTGGAPVWTTVNPPVSASTFGFPRPGPTGVAIGPDNSPIVTGKLLNASGDYVIRTVKYTPGGFFGGAQESWSTASVDTGFGVGDTGARAIVADGASNAIVVGETRNSDGNADLYVAKYDAQTGQRVFAIAFNGTFSSSDDIGVGIATDRFGNIAALGDLVANKQQTNIGRREFGTVKLNRLIAPTGDDLPDGIAGVADDATVAVAGTPAISDSGVLATRLTFKNGRKSGHALLVEGSAAGGTLLPAVQGQSAPVASGDPEANWVSFSDPVIAPDGSYAFAAKVSGSGSKANGVWTNLSGTLNLALRQGSVVPGTTDKLSKVLNLAVENNALVALVKLASSGSTNTALIRLDSANAGTVLLRTGQSGFMINGTDYTVKSITIFSPPAQEAGDGRWQGSLGVVARVTATKTSDSKSKATAIVSVTNGGVQNAFLFTGQTAPAPIVNATYKDFGFPSTAFGTFFFGVKASLSGVPAANNSALIYSPVGTTFSVFGQKGVATGVSGLPSGVTYGDFSDPIINTNGQVAFIGTLKGSKADVKGSSNKAIIFGSPTSTLTSIARTGDSAPDTAGEATSVKWTSFTSVALPGGTNAGPIFVAKVNTKKDNVGLWARDSSGTVRLLIRAGDDLDGQIVKKITLLTTISKAASAPRSFDAAGSVAVALTFKDGTTALRRIGIP